MENKINESKRSSFYSSRVGCRSSWNFMAELSKRQKIEQGKKNFERYVIQNFDGNFNFRKPTGECKRPAFLWNGDFFAKFKL